MIFYTGDTVRYKGEKMSVVDTDFLARQAKIGIQDTNGMFFDTYWVDWDDLEKEKNHVRSHICF
jgi:hypothetical protein